MITPEDLLDFAFHLTTRAADTEAYARRAISASYYAVFHAVAQAGASLFTGEAAVRDKIARSYDHGSLAKAAEELDRRGAAEAVRDPRLVTVARSLRRLREAREQADYDLASSFTWDDAEELMWEAFDACRLLADLEGASGTAEFLLAPLIQRRNRRG